jgi:hypothetical protein
MSRILRPGLALPPPRSCDTPLAARGSGGQSTAELPAARTIIDRHIQEIGGREAILAQTSTHATGTVSLPAAGLTGKLEAYHAKPNKFLQRMSLPGIGDIEEGFDGTVGWSLSPLTGPTLVEGKQLEQRKFDADFYEDLKPGDRYASITTLEKTTFEGRPVFKIRLVRSGGDEDIEYYDSETGLKAGAISTRDSPMGPMQATTAFSDYKRVRQPPPSGDDQNQRHEHADDLAITAVEYGKVDPSIFAVPRADQAADQVNRRVSVLLERSPSRRDRLPRGAGVQGSETFDAAWTIIRDSHFDPR